MQYRFTQVDVFSDSPHGGNPVAVVHAAQDLSRDQMAAFARWTNLSETTFLLPPDHREADYRLRIFTPGGELPFAGHPTLGSCHAWLEAGGVPRDEQQVIQECGVGLVRVRRGAQMAFAAPALQRDGPVDERLLAQLIQALDLPESAVLGHQWVDNGPGWCALLLDSAERVLAVKPNFQALGNACLGIVGKHPAGGPADFEVRAFVPSLGVPEDPVTGSLNAGIARWLMGAGIAPDRYVVAQGTVLGRRGRVHLERLGSDIWVGGVTRTRVVGTADFG